MAIGCMRILLSLMVWNCVDCFASIRSGIKNWYVKSLYLRFPLKMPGWIWQLRSPDGTLNILLVLPKLVGRKNWRRLSFKVPICRKRFFIQLYITLWYNPIRWVMLMVNIWHPITSLVLWQKGRCIILLFLYGILSGPPIHFILWYTRTAFPILLRAWWGNTIIMAICLYGNYGDRIIIVWLATTPFLSLWMLFWRVLPGWMKRKPMKRFLIVLSCLIRILLLKYGRNMDICRRIFRHNLFLLLWSRLLMIGVSHSWLSDWEKKRIIIILWNDLLSIGICSILKPGSSSLRMIRVSGLSHLTLISMGRMEVILLLKGMLGNTFGMYPRISPIWFHWQGGTKPLSQSWIHSLRLATKVVHWMTMLPVL